MTITNIFENKYQKRREQAMGNKNRIVIRHAEVSDIDRIMLIEHESFHKKICESKEVFYQRISLFHDGFLVLEINGDVCGYISSEIWDYAEQVRDTNFTLDHKIDELHTTTGSELYITSIGVLQDHRKKGYGSMLFSELSTRIIENYNIQSMILLVSENWQAARNIYKKAGFNEIRKISGFFEEDDIADGVVMRKKL